MVLYLYIMLLPLVARSHKELPHAHTGAIKATRIGKVDQTKRTVKQLMSREVEPVRTRAKAFAVKDRPKISFKQKEEEQIELPEFTQEEANEFLFIGGTYTGANSQETPQENPDIAADAGTQQLLFATRGRIRTFNKRTNSIDGVLNTTLDRFFSPVSNGDYVSSPQVQYLDRHWYLAARTQNRLLLAHTDESEISSSTEWTFSVVDEQEFLDGVTLAVDNNAIYIGLGVTDHLGTRKTELIIMPKEDFLQGTPIANRFSLPSFGSVVQPAQNFDEEQPFGYLLSYDTTNNNTLLLSRILEPGSPLPIIEEPIKIPTPIQENSPTILANGSTKPISAPDRSLGQVHIRNNQLYSTQSIGISNKAAIRVYQIDLATFSLVQSPTLMDETTSYIYGSVMTNPSNKIVLGATSAGPETPLNAVVSLFVDETFKTERYTESTNIFNPTDDYKIPGTYSWGTYSKLISDQIDTNRIWSLQSWCSAKNIWGVEITKFIITS